MVKKWLIPLFALILLLSMTACGQNKTAYESLKQGSAKLAEADSFEYSGALALQLDTKSAAEAEETQVMQMLSNVEVKFSGVQYKKAKKASVNLELNLKGDMSFSLAIPVVVDNENIYVKIPQIPMLPLPEEITGKYVHLTKEDIEKLSAEAAQSKPDLDPDKEKQLSKELGDVFAKHFKEDDQLVKVSRKKSSADVPDHVKQVIEYSITNDSFPLLVEKVVKNLIPDIITVLNKPEYQEMTGVQADTLENYQKSLDGFTTDELKKQLTVNEAIAQFGLDGSGYLSYLRDKFDFTSTEENGDKANTAFDLSFNATNINKTKAEVVIPKKEETISLTELQEQFGTSFLSP
ncbi:hypothetical protein [Gorillibacterium timonense]|uniref:hypothetical protein n=1 Tax=Gorillibacterium timonense TaxID=1689269 RepID=UPI00071E61DD|nr:hypothetical protein [Gorillibacterium timonense]